MSEQENTQKNTGAGFWARLRENAISITTRHRDDLQRLTCPPEFCLEERDREVMRHRQYLIGADDRDIATLGQDTCRSRMLALYMVLLFK